MRLIFDATVIAAENPAGSAFKDPYNGGIRLPNGGGEPGRAYMAFINAAYRKDRAEICRLMADPAEVPICLQQKEALNSYIAMFTQPKSHKVLGGFMKGEEATLDVVYTLASGPQSAGFVVMKKTQGRWIISSSGGSGSATISAEASGTADLSRGSGAGTASVVQTSGAAYTGPALGKWAFKGKDSKGGVWTGTLTISEQDSGGTKYRDCTLDAESNGTSSGVGSECEWDPAKRAFSFGPEPNGRYTAILSADGKKLTQGKWSEGEKNMRTRQVTVNRTGVWSATCVE